jgi:glycosyltransferase involved in cell wall biosynthesis
VTKVTIGVCVRNGESLIADAIKSIIDQNFSHKLMEVVFVDDGSEDKTLSIIKDYIPKMDLKVKVVSHKWRGLGATRNVVVNNTNGEYIIWVDCDMVLTQDFVRKQVAFMDNNPNVGIAKGRYGMYDTSSLVAYLENVEAMVKHLDMHAVSSEALGTGGSIYRVEAIKKVGGFNDNITGVGEDMDVENKISKAGWLLTISPAEFYEMRRNTWRDLWNEYFWHGSGGHQIVRKVSPHSLLYRLFPPAAILTEFFRSRTAYKLTHKKVVFLLPIHWIFKRVSWCIGFVMSRLINLHTN